MLNNLITNKKLKLHNYIKMVLKLSYFINIYTQTSIMTIYVNSVQIITKEFEGSTTIIYDLLVKAYM